MSSIGVVSILQGKQEKNSVFFRWGTPSALTSAVVWPPSIQFATSLGLTGEEGAGRVCDRWRTSPTHQWKGDAFVEPMKALLACDGRECMEGRVVYEQSATDSGTGISPFFLHLSKREWWDRFAE